MRSTHFVQVLWDGYAFDASVTFALYHRNPSVCLSLCLSLLSVCDVGAPYCRGLNFSAIFLHHPLRDSDSLH